MHSKKHWDLVHETKPADSVSWFQEYAELSLQLIRQTGSALTAPIIDVGGGASTLVDDLLALGYSNLTVLDISSTALQVAQARLGNEHSRNVQWMAADITEAGLPVHAYEVWHDRAVFHFLATPEERQQYVQALFNALRPGGHAIIATFAEDGPTRCSGLSAMRYRPEQLQAELGKSFALVRHRKEAHKTPSGSLQQFVYCCFRKCMIP